jgi:hypothetical protein
VCLAGRCEQSGADPCPIGFECREDLQACCPPQGNCFAQ